MTAGDRTQSAVDDLLWLALASRTVPAGATLEVQLKPPAALAAVRPKVGVILCPHARPHGETACAGRVDLAQLWIRTMDTPLVASVKSTPPWSPERLDVVGGRDVRASVTSNRKGPDGHTAQQQNSAQQIVFRCRVVVDGDRPKEEPPDETHPSGARNLSACPHRQGVTSDHVVTILAAVVGAALIALANYDALVTTVAVGSGSRPLTAQVARGLRSLLRRVPSALPAGGPLVVLATIGVWISLLWGGYSLVLFADADAITATANGTPASAVSRVYYAGYILFTLGNGGYTPAVGWWEIFTVIATLNGLFVATLAISYLVPVVSAVVERREQAALVNALGGTAEQVVVSAWNGQDFAFLEQQLPAISQQVLLTAQRHLAYPVLHDFRSRDQHTASERTLALLDDVVLLVDKGVDPSIRLSSPVVQTMRFAIDEARRLMPIDHTADQAPPLPDLEQLAAHGIPIVDVAVFEAAASAFTERRRHLAAMVHAAAWPWPNSVAQRKP